ncbi:MAG: hypothetical protein M3478_11810 [Planctomycetota bacterium]|nr:hypothetical protein [Planctomycetota bacterium]
MVKLDAGNVLLKPSQRRQLMSWLKRAMHLGKRIGDFLLTIKLKRQGRLYDVRATVHDAVGDFKLGSRSADCREAFRTLCRKLAVRLHDQALLRRAASA